MSTIVSLIPVPTSLSPHIQRLLARMRRRRRRADARDLLRLARALRRT